MATIEQVQKGFTKMVDSHIAVAFEGWQRAIVAGSAALIAANFPKLVETYAAHPFVEALGVYEAKSGNIDVDTLYSAFVPTMGSDKIPISIPKIGTIKLGREEFDLFYRYIKEA